MKGYRCFSCGETQAAKYTGCLCPSCGGNLDIAYDYAAVARNIERLGIDRARYIFTFAPFLPVKTPGKHFALRIGATPLYPANRLGALLGLRNLFLKDDTVNPSASSKDRASAIVVRRAMDIGADIVSVARFPRVRLRRSSRRLYHLAPRFSQSAATMMTRLISAGPPPMNSAGLIAAPAITRLLAKARKSAHTKSGSRWMDGCRIASWYQPGTATC